MKRLFLALLTCAMLHAEDTKPTYTTNPEAPDFQTGYQKRPLTMEEHKAAGDFAGESQQENWSFGYDVSRIHLFKDKIGGYKPPAEGSLEVTRLSFAGEKMKSASLNDFGMPRANILDQGSCGSCVCAAFTGGVMDIVLQRGISLPDNLSIGALMWCSNGSQCSGADGETIAADTVRLGGLPTNKDIPYIPRNGRCPNTSQFDKYGDIVGWETLPKNSTRDILAAIHARLPVMVGVAADNKFSAYSDGVYNPQSFSMGTNHYVKATAIDCEDAVDADGYCAFNDAGELPPGKGIIDIDNSWGTRYGNQGRIRMKITDLKGRRTNNIAGGFGNAQILKTSLPLPPKDPVTVTGESGQYTYSITVHPAAKYTADQAKALISMALLKSEAK